MWKTFGVDDDTYMLKFSNNEELYKVYLSDLKSIWSQNYSKGDVIKHFKEFNPVIVVEDEEAVSQTENILNGIDNAIVTVNRNDEEISLNIKSEILGISDTKFKLKYELTLLIGDQFKFTEELVAPMIHTIHHLEKQQRMLCDLVRKKDRELEEYKMEKGLISRTDLLTEKFESNCLKASSDNKLMLDTFSESNKFWESFTNKYGEIKADVMDVKVEPWNQVKRKRKTYNAKTSAKKFATVISYKKD